MRSEDDPTLPLLLCVVQEFKNHLNKKTATRMTNQNLRINSAAGCNPPLFINTKTKIISRTRKDKIGLFLKEFAKMVLNPFHKL